MSHIYIISNNATPDKYKVGCNMGTMDELLDNHTNSIHLLLEVGNAEQLVNDIHKTGSTFQELETYIYANGTNIGDEDMYYYEARRCPGCVWCTQDTIVPCRGHVYIMGGNDNKYKVGYNRGTK